MSRSDIIDAPQWGRLTPWRQGSVLSQELCVALGLLGVTEIGAFWIVLSHDCDCVQDADKEPRLELILAQLKTEADPNCTYSKNPRTLDLEILLQGSKQVLRFEIDNRRFISKSDIGHHLPDPIMALREDERTILARWIAARYIRAALPDALVHRLRFATETLRNSAQNNPFAILGIYLDYDPRGELQSDDEPYELRIAIVYNSNHQGSAEAASQVGKALWTRFERKYKTLDTENAGLQWKLIELTLCEAISDTAFSLRDALEYKLYHFEHLSLRQNPIAESAGTV